MGNQMDSISVEVPCHINELFSKHNITISDVIELASDSLLSVQNDMMDATLCSQFREELAGAFSGTSRSTTEEVVELFFLAHDGDLNSFISHVLRMGYSRAYRIVSVLIERELLKRGGGYRFEFERI